MYTLCEIQIARDKPLKKAVEQNVYIYKRLTGKYKSQQFVVKLNYTGKQNCHSIINIYSL